MAQLNRATPNTLLAPDDFRQLGYVQYMAATARTEAARQMFTEYLRLEKRRLEVVHAPAETKPLPSVPVPSP